MALKWELRPINGVYAPKELLRVGCFLDSDHAIITPSGYGRCYIQEGRGEYRWSCKRTIGDTEICASGTEYSVADAKAEVERLWSLLDSAYGEPDDNEA